MSTLSVVSYEVVKGKLSINLTNMDLPIQSNSGTGQDANATPDTSEHTDVNQTNQTQDAAVTLDKDDSEKDVKLKRAITEAIAKDKEAKDAKSKLSYLEAFKKVAKDPNQIVQINETDPELAEKLAGDIYGKSYDQIFDKEEKGMNAADIEKIVAKAMAAEKSKADVGNIDKTIEDFFVENKIQPGTELFRKINEDFHGYTVKSSDQAKNVLSGLLRTFKSENTSNVEDNSPSMGQNVNTSKKRNKNLSNSAEDLIKSFGYGDDQIKKAFAK